MTAQGEKEQILKNNGYVYNFDYELYFNRSVKKAFSMDFIEHESVSAEEIEKRVQERHDGKGWQFHFDGDPPDSIRRQLEAVLG